jgi:glycopeptide antibiotics resistance protein
MKHKEKNKLTIILFVVYILLLTAVILFKLPFYSAEFSDGIRVVNLVPLQGSFDENGHLLLLEMIYNTLFFIPLGVYLGMLKSEWPFVKKALSVICLSLTFEVVQLIFAMGRTDITDLINNTLGGIIGIGIYALLQAFLKIRTVKIVNVLALIATVYIGFRFAHLFYISYFVMGRLAP